MRFGLPGQPLFPALGSAIAARGAQAMQDGKKYGPFHGEIEVTAGEKFGKHLLAARLAPKSLED